MLSRHMAKEQKFRVLTGIMCNSHGCAVDKAGPSTGSVFPIESSSSIPSCQTRSLWSLPWLFGNIDQSVGFDPSEVDITHVIVRSGPQCPTPSTAFSWAFHTATGRLEDKFQDTTHPSASAVKRRLLPCVKCTACTWAEWPRKTKDGCAGGSKSEDMIAIGYCFRLLVMQNKVNEKARQRGREQ